MYIIKDSLLKKKKKKRKLPKIIRRDRLHNYWVTKLTKEEPCKGISGTGLVVNVGVGVGVGVGGFMEDMYVRRGKLYIYE